MGGPKELKGKKFALIVDEAHSSQSGEGAKDLKLVLTTPDALRAIIAEDDENKEWTDPVAEELFANYEGVATLAPSIVFRVHRDAQD